MRLALVLSLAVLVGVLATGCGSMGLSPVVSWITVHEKGPVSVGDMSVKADKVGKSMAQGILIVAWGDASIEAACKSAGITRIHHVDSEVLNVIGAYAEYTTVVYGD